MHKSLAAVFIAFALFLGAAVFSISYAQEAVNDGTFNSAPGTTNDTQTGTTTEDTGGFDWRWLLPLLAIPVVLLFLNDKREDETTRYYDRPMAGAKGGRSKRERNEEDDE